MNIRFQNSDINAGVRALGHMKIPIILNKASAQLLSSAQNTANFLTLYRLYFPTLYLFSKVTPTEGRTGTDLEPSKEEICCPLLSLPPNFLCLSCHHRVEISNGQTSGRYR
jgi:hypothetical protein